MRSKRGFGLVSVILGLLMAVIPAAAASAQDSGKKVMLKGTTTASYFWDDGSGRAGDTGLPASGEPMQKTMAASPSWPLMTEGYVVYEGKKMPFFVGDRGPGDPSEDGIMLDLDAKTFAELTGGDFNEESLMVEGNGGKGHIDVKYVITKWGDGPGKKDQPVPFSTGAWDEYDDDPAEPVRLNPKKSDQPKAEAGQAAQDNSSKSKESGKQQKSEKSGSSEKSGKSGDDQKGQASGKQDEDEKSSAAGGDNNRANTNGERKAADATELASQESESSGGPGGWVLAVALVLVAAGLVGLFGWFRRQRASEDA